MLARRFSLPSLSLIGLAGLLAAFQLLKGLSTAPHAYGLIPFLHTYADGAVRRALLPSLMAGVGLVDLNNIAKASVYLHLFCLVGIAAAIASMAVSTVGTRRWLAWGLLASCQLPGVAALTGYSDSLIILLLLGSAYYLRQQRFGLALILMMMGLLQHEIMLALVLPLLLSYALIYPVQRRSIIIMSLAISAGAVLLFITPTVLPVLPAAPACALYQPLDELQRLIWNEYCQRLTSLQVTDDFNVLRLVLLPLFALTTGLLVPILLAGFITAIVPMQKTISRVGVALALALPYGFIFFMWDADRLLLLGAFSNWLVLDLWLAAAHSPSAPRQTWQQLALIGLVLFQLALNYPVVDHYAVDRVMPPAQSQRWFISTRPLALAWLSSMGAPAPESLIVCVDPRCQKNMTEITRQQK